MPYRAARLVGEGVDDVSKWPVRFYRWTVDDLPRAGK